MLDFPRVASISILVYAVFLISSAQPSDAGFYGPFTGYWPSTCPDGRVCPIQYQCMNKTDGYGFGCVPIYGPDCTDGVQACAPGLFCQPYSAYPNYTVTLGACMPCWSGTFCPQSVTQPIECTAGSMCPTIMLSAPIPCPGGTVSNHYSDSCRECPNMFYTSNASRTRCNEMTPITICLIIIASILLLTGITVCIRRRRRNRKAAAEAAQRADLGETGSVIQGDIKFFQNPDEMQGARAV